MNNKTLGYVLAAVGVVGAILSFVLTSHSFSSKKFDLGIGLAVIFVVVGLYFAFAAPSNTAAR